MYENGTEMFYYIILLILDLKIIFLLQFLCDETMLKYQKDPFELLNF